MGRREYEALWIIAVITVSMILGNTVLPSLLGASNYLYYFKPLFWLGLSVYVWKKPRCRFKGKLKLYKFIIVWSVICSIIYISIYFSGGFINGVGGNPYSRKLGGMAANVLSFGSVLAMMEWVRNYIINRIKKKFVPVFSILTIIVFTLYKLNLRIIMTLDSLPLVVQYIGEYALPEIMNNIFLTYLVYIGGSFPAVIYTLMTSVPIWIIPVLPSLRWITKAFIGIMANVGFIIVIRLIYKKQTKEIKMREQKGENPYVWIPTGIISILIIWFAVGVFPIFPTVILTGSMQPVMDPGDVAIIRKTNEVEPGDVIQYWTGEIFIIHRIIAIDQTTGKYITKGDNNSAPDGKTVGKEQIKGKMIGVVPKVGLLNYLLRMRDQTPPDNVVF